METYQVTYKRQIWLLSHMILTHLVLLCFCFYLFGWVGVTYITLSLLLLTSAIPTLVLHFQYLLKNRELILTINKEEKYILLTKNSEVKKYSFDYIKEAILYSSYGGGTGWYSFAEYRYCKLLFKDGTDAIITCLLMKDLNGNLVNKIGLEAECRSKVLAII